jgi:two-component system, OmpR family, response regulator ChvI
MIVDDERDIVDVMRMSLKRSGFRVDAFYEPIEALHQFRSGKYDLALIDVRMPIMDGFTLYKHMKVIDPQLKVCFMTALSEAAIISEKISNMRKVCVAKKPISTEELVLLLRAELDSMNQDVDNIDLHPSSEHTAHEC